MKPTWRVQEKLDNNSTNCQCLICGNKFLSIRGSHVFNMRLVTCSCCKQQVWVPRCPNGCPSFDDSDSPEHLGNSIKFDDYIPEDAKNEEHY